MWIQGYYPVYRIASLSPANLPWSRLTHLAYFNLAPTSTGGLENTVNGDLLDEMENVVDTAHANDVKVVVTIGGASAASDATWRAAVNSTNRATFVAAIADYISDNNLDGVDIDWEPFDTESDGTDFALFIIALRAALPAEKCITMFIAIQPAWKRTLCNTIQDDIDRFGLSTYDLSYGETDTMHDAPLHVTGSQPAGKSAAAAADAFITAGVSAAKICIAVPFYTANWPNATGLYTSPGAFDPGAARLYSSLPGASGTTAPTGEQFDSDAKGAYLIGPPFESYNNAAAIQAKVDYVNAEGLGGIIIWELGQGYFSGDTPTFPLMEPFVGEVSLGAENETCKIPDESC